MLCNPDGAAKVQQKKRFIEKVEQLVHRSE